MNHHIGMHFKGHEELVSRIFDLQEMAKRYRRAVFTPFLNAFEQEIVLKVSKGYDVSFAGGFEDAESKMASISYYEEEVVFPIVCLRASFKKEYYQIQHKDVLGSLLNLGLQRNIIGDILVEEDCVYVFVSKDTAPFIIEEGRQIRRCSVLFEPYVGEVQSTRSFLWEEKIVSSFRLDAIVAVICKVNREKAKLFISSGNVKVNQVVLEDCTYLCHNNSAISIRGFGRFILEMSERRTKKERHVIMIGKYI